MLRSLTSHPCRALCLWEAPRLPSPHCENSHPSMDRNPRHFITHSMQSLPYLKLGNQKADLTITSVADKPLHCRCPPSPWHPGSEKKPHTQWGKPQGARAGKGERAGEEKESQEPRALYLPLPWVPPPLHCRSWAAPARDPESGARPSTALQPQAPAQQQAALRAGGKGSTAGGSALPGLSPPEESSTSCAGETRGWCCPAPPSPQPKQGQVAQGSAEYELCLGSPGKRGLWFWGIMLFQLCFGSFWLNRALAQHHFPPVQPSPPWQKSLVTLQGKSCTEVQLGWTLSPTAGQGQWKDKAGFPNLGVMNLLQQLFPQMAFKSIWGNVMNCWTRVSLCGLWAALTAHKYLSGPAEVPSLPGNSGFRNTGVGTVLRIIVFIQQVFDPVWWI